MKWSSTLPFVAALCHLIEAAPGGSDSAGWTDWVTVEDYVTVTDWETKYVPTTYISTYWSTITVPTTVIVPTTVTKPTTYTVTTTEVVPTTYTVTTTEVVPTTYTVTTTEVVPTTYTATTTVPVPTTITVVSTVVSVSGQTVVNTVQNTQTIVNTVQNTQTINNVQTVQVTSISVATQTVSVSYCPITTSTLTGLVPCPSRITNEQGYTPPTPLPTTYLWGCPPGQLCHPIQINCNFESNPPAPGYVCPPSQCKPVAPLPPIKPYTPEPYNATTCAWFTPIDDYFNINPTYFGLNFNIFATDGQTTCTPTPAPPTTTMATTTKYVPPTTTTWAVWTTTTAPSSSGWDEWQSGAAHVTKRAILPRQDFAVYAGPACYAVCDDANYVVQSVGSVPALCDPAGDFQLAISAVDACTIAQADAGDAGLTTMVTVLDGGLDYCASIGSTVMRKRSPRTMMPA